MSAVGTILLHSPGWNEGKARYETLGKQGDIKIMSSFRSGTNSANIEALALGLCRPYGAQKNVYQYLTQGLRPGLCRSVALTGLLYVFSINTLYYFDALALTCESLEHEDTRLRAHIK